MNVYLPPYACFLRGLIANLNVILWRINVFNLKCILKKKKSKVSYKWLRVNTIMGYYVITRLY